MKYNKIKDWLKRNITIILTSLVLLASVGGLCSNFPYLYRYTSYLSAEISFINEHGMQYEFLEDEKQPETKGPGFYIAPPLAEKGENEFKIFIDEDTHNLHKKMVAVFGASSSVLLLSSAYCVLSLVNKFKEGRLTKRTVTSR